ncbi:YheC/YheD family protein [Lentibacillus sp. CBA3610]|uniref:YheC/YheD family protein n=1 Tax=Lentibacillus sp. CBA3610 TaxID=2518176 RepID=UPI001595BAD1|nr:YheC/YheD family protein [Lentibacillus sp. CBA3610]QKY70426.1 hypothetical protein Len3610_13230 [Lentibacillus sp. CBA3610]
MQVIGYMRVNKKPMKMARLLAKVSKYNNIELIYFSPTDIDLNREVIHGKRLVNNKWITEQMSVPKYIDISPYCFKHKKEIQFLKQHSTLSSSGKLGTKTFVNKKILDDGHFSDLIIPTNEFTCFDNFYSFLKQYKEIIIKPKNGVKGKNIYMLKQEKNNYILSYNHKNRKNY